MHHKTEQQTYQQESKLSTYIHPAIFLEEETINILKSHVALVHHFAQRMMKQSALLSTHIERFSVSNMHFSKYKLEILISLASPSSIFEPSFANVPKI
jgi:hypothetical protein